MDIDSQNVWNSTIRQPNQRCPWRSGSRKQVFGLKSAWAGAVCRLDPAADFLDLTRCSNLNDEAQLRQEPTDRDIGARKEAVDPRGVLKEHGGTKEKSEERNYQGFKVGDEGDLHDLAAGKQP